jgi:polyphenol oxidase
MVERLFLTSRLLAAHGVVHGFSVRAGGVSTGPHASLNLSRAVGDDPRAVDENLHRLARAAGLAADAFASADQVHADRVVGALHSGMREIFSASTSAQATGEEPGGSSAPAGGRSAKGAASDDAVQADAIVALEPAVAASVRIADCVPILLYAPDAGLAAAVHSGWRGARLSIAGRGVRALQHVAGADPASLLAAIGPSIGRCCYEVSADLAATFRALFGADAADDPARVPRPHLDLRRVVESALVAAGVRPERIEHVGGCTSCDASLYFSHRRDRGRTGRHLAFIAARAS